MTAPVPSPGGAGPGAPRGLPWSRRLAGAGGSPLVGLAHTSRAGGCSEGPWAGLDLATHVGDDPGHVERNRAELAGVLAGQGVTSTTWLEQVHGDEVVVVREGPVHGADVPRADAAVTDVPGLALAVLVADCVPVLLADPAAGVVGVAHAGRRGMAAGVALRAVEAMTDLGAREVHAVLAPSICPRCYEVPAELRDEVAAAHPVTASTSWTGTPALDVAAGVAEQLRPVCRTVEQLPGCTAERPDLWSYRRTGTSGRFAGLAWVAAS